VSTAVQYLKGVGPARAKRLAKLNLYTVADLVHHYPRSYQVRRRAKIGDLPAHSGETVLVRGTIAGTPEVRLSRVPLLLAVIADETGSVRCTWFNQNYLKSRLKPGMHITVAGKYSGEYRNIVVEQYALEQDLPEILPLYNLTQGISNAVMGQIIAAAMREHRETELFPADFRQKYRLLPAQKALEVIHFPAAQGELEQAQYTIKFTELFVYQLSFLYWRKIKQQLRGYCLQPCPDLLTRLETAYGFRFTPDQARAMKEIEDDLSRPVPMNRLLQGDVGSGKTAVASYGLFTCALNGYKAVMMVPTEIVARQHYATLKQVAASFGIPVFLLTGAAKKSEREMVQAELNKNQGLVLVGTHALFQEGVSIPGLALVVTDEQHRFGVQQRFALTEKGENPHVLAMSATPIPRTLAMTIYGDLDISALRMKPGGRKKIITRVLHSSRRQQVFDFISGEIAKGNVGYIVCPLIEDSEKVDALSLEKYQALLKRGLPQWCKFGVLHGRMSGEEKEQIVAALKKREVHILLATTVVEVGVDVADATFMVVENSERYGLAQLHQLRGRVGRRDRQSYCFLLTDGQDRERLKILEETDDGLAVSMADLQIRGSGQLLGLRQHGVNEFVLADVVRDGDIARVSRAAARETVPVLDTAPEWQQVWEVVQEKIRNLKS